MSFESGGEVDNPFDDEDEDDEGSDTAENTDAEDLDRADTDSRTEATERESTNDPQDLEGRATPAASENSTTEASSEVDYVTDLSAGQIYSATTLAKALMEPEYHSESPPVPYATWRDGTSTGRNRTTLELNQDVDDLVRKAQSEFEDRYGTNITKADLREFAMVYGLAHIDDVFEMAEEWGIQYDN